MSGMRGDDDEQPANSSAGGNVSRSRDSLKEESYKVI